MSALTQHEVDSRSLVSVILPTHNRSALLRAAIASVQAQLYPHWELVVVDDGSDDDTWDYLRSLRDERVRCLRRERAGVSAARNSGLAAARGTLVAYLDDDNRLHPGWLRAVAFGFAEAPQSNVMYGARLIGRAGRAADETEVRVDFVPFSRRRLRISNLIDVGVLAHRAGLPEARFDESLQTFADWDLVLRLTASERPLPLPVIACHYSTSAPSRLSTSRAPAREFSLIRQRIRRRH